MRANTPTAAQEPADRAGESGGVNKMTPAIIIPTNRPARAQECLNHIRSLYRDVRVITVESGDSSAGAKNIGASPFSLVPSTPSTPFDILIFLDDDTEIHPGFLEAILRQFSPVGNVDLVSAVFPRILDAPGDPFSSVASQDMGPKWRCASLSDIGFIGLLSPIALFRSGQLRERAPLPWGFGYGTCMAFRRSFFEKIGGFREDYGTGKRVACCEDIEIIYRAIRAGGFLVYCPEAMVTHRQDRHSPEAIAARRYQYNQGNAGFLLDHIREPRMAFIFAAMLLRLLQRSALHRDCAGADLRGFLAGIRNWKCDK